MTKTVKAAVYLNAKSSEVALAQAHGVSTMASEFHTIQPLSTTVPEELNKVNKPRLSDCSAELYLGYLRVSKNQSKEGVQQTCL